LSWIRWRSPFSDSARIAVDISTAKGESLGNAWFTENTDEQRKESAMETNHYLGKMFMYIGKVHCMYVQGFGMSTFSLHKT
jgi:hypothetical protein